jgi:hypothetical protein
LKSELRHNIPDQSQQAELQHAQYLSLLAVLAIVGQVIVLASAWLLPAVSEFSLIGDNISELVLGRYGFVQTAAFVIAGLGTLALAFAIYQLTAHSWKSSIGSLLVAVYGVGAILIALFPTDRIDSQADLGSLSPTGAIHILIAFVSFLCIIAGMFLLTWAFMGKARWRSFRPWLMLFPAGALSLFFVQTEGPLVGILQRMFITIVSVWLILVAFKVRSIAASGEIEPSG